MFTGKVIVITGGSSGLGRALAERLVKKGASLALISRNPDKLATVKENLISACTGTQKIEVFPCDISNFTKTRKTLSLIVDSFGLPDILINSAGILKEGYFEEIPLSAFREVMDVNFFGVINCVKAIIPLFKQKGRGRIVNIASLGGRIGAFGYSAYGSSKFALIGLSETLRVELKPQNIKVQMVCPGEFDSPMVDELNAGRTKENMANAQTVPVLSLDVVADGVIKGIENDQFLILPGLTTRFFDWLNRLAPSLLRTIVDYKVSKIYIGPKK